MKCPTMGKSALLFALFYADATPAAETLAGPVIPPLLRESKLNYTTAAGEVMAYIQAKLYLRDSGLYSQSLRKPEPDFMWGNGVMFSALAGAARHDPQYRPIMDRFFKSMDRYWDFKARFHGYEPAPTTGNGNDKYYDDNAWMVLTFVEAFAMTADPTYQKRAEESLTFVLSGQDDVLGGGIYWHAKKKSKNTCVNAPAAVGCLALAPYMPADRATTMIETAKQLADWTTKTLQADDGRYYDAVSVGSGKIEKTKWTYNTSLMIRAYLGLHRNTGDARYLEQAKRIGAAADAFIDFDRKAYREKDFKFNHLLMEADLELFRATRDDRYLKRAILGAEFAYKQWKESPPIDLIENASIARMLWLMADMQTDTGQAFWQRIDSLSAKK